jgi:hypothetical protein
VRAERAEEADMEWGWIVAFTVVAGVGMLPLVADTSSGTAKLVESSIGCLLFAFLAALLVIALPETIA